MDHIELYVSNLQKTKLFYSKFLVQLGFELFQEWEEGFSYKKGQFLYRICSSQRKISIN